MKMRFWKVDWTRYMVKKLARMVRGWHVWFVRWQEARKQRCKLNATVWEIKWRKWHNSWPKLGSQWVSMCIWTNTGIYKSSIISLSTHRGEATRRRFQLCDVLVLAISHMYISDFAYPWYADVWNACIYIYKHIEYIYIYTHMSIYVYIYTHVDTQ